MTSAKGRDRRVFRVKVVRRQRTLEIADSPEAIESMIAANEPT